MTDTFTYNSTEKKRLDSYLTEVFADMSRSHIAGLIKEGKITVNGKNVKTGYSLQPGDIIEAEEEEPEDAAAVPEDIPLDIVYEDDDVIVVNKPKGMVVHPAAGHASGTLVNALLFHCRDSLSGINGVLRPGIVHRIDMDTTGLVIACKNDFSHNSIAAQLKEHSTVRRYTALCQGIIKEDEGTIDKNIGRSPKDRKKMAVVPSGCGKNAVTHYRVLERYEKNTLIECRLETGRTHQIRVHMASIGHPLCGDEVYGIKDDRFPGNGQYLHARVLGFKHPRSGIYMEFDSDLPQYFTETLSRLSLCQASHSLHKG